MSPPVFQKPITIDVIKIEIQYYIVCMYPHDACGSVMPGRNPDGRSE